MSNGQEEFLTVSSFKVSIDGHNWEVFESVDGIGLNMEDIAYYDDKNLIKNKPGRCIARDITLTRHFKKDKELYNWFKDVKLGKTVRKSGSIMLLDDAGKEICRFNFFEAWPKCWSAPTLSKNTANGGHLLKETVVLSVRDVEMV